MKLLPVTSFYLFLVILLLLTSCNTGNKELENTTNDSLKSLDSIVRKKNIIKEFNSAIYYGHKEFKLAKILGNEFYLKQSLTRLETAHRKNKNNDSAIFYADELYEIAKQYNDISYMAKARSRKGLNFKLKDEQELAYQNYLESLELYENINESISIGKKYYDIATLEKKFGNYGASQESALDGLRYIENTSEIKTISGLYHIIAVAAKEKGDFKLAMKRIDQALALTKDSIGIKKIQLKDVITLNNTKANIFKETEEYNLAVAIYENLLVDNKNILSIKEKARINGNLAHTLFLKEGFNKRSDSLLKNSLSIYKKSKYLSGLHSVYIKLADIYSEKDPLKSIYYVNKSLEYAREMKNENSIHQALEAKILIDSNNNNSNSNELNEYVTLGKRIEQKERASQSFITNIKFDLEKEKNKTIKAENKVITAKKETAEKENLILILTLILIVLIVVIFFIYQKIKRRHKIEKVKTVHNTEARISSKVHDELANDVYKLMTQLETSDPEKEVILDKLDFIYNNARDISKQIQSIDTGEGFPDELNNLFRSYRSDDVNVLLKRYEIEIWNGISAHIKTTIYRVLQELLTNMKKHSNAMLVVVSIEKENKKLFIQYIDNGKGFSEEISKNGLQNAENRIHAIQGSLTFDTELHKGCKFSINVPV